MFNYIDRQVLAAVLPSIEKSYTEHDSASKDATATENAPEPAKVVPPSKQKLGYLQAAFMFSYFLFAPLFGLLADRMSRWKIIGVGVILWSLASGASGLAPTLLILFFTRCAVGLGEAAYGPAAPTIISDLYPISMRGKVMAWFYVAIPVGSALGYVLGGLVLTHIGDWRWAFYLVTPPGILLGIWCFFMPEPSRGQSEKIGAVTRRATWEDLSSLLRTPSYVLCTLGMTAMTFAMGGIAYWLPYYLVKAHNIEVGKANYYFGLVVVISGLSATLLGGMAGDRLRKRFPGSYFLVSGIAMLVGFPMIALVLISNGTWLWLCIFMACFALFFNTGPTNTILANVTHPQILRECFCHQHLRDSCSGRRRLASHHRRHCRPLGHRNRCANKSRPSGRLPGRFRIRLLGRTLVALGHSLSRTRYGSSIGTVGDSGLGADPFILLDFWCTGT